MRLVRGSGGGGSFRLATVSRRSVALSVCLPAAVPDFSPGSRAEQFYVIPNKFVFKVALIASNFALFIFLLW